MIIIAIIVVVITNTTATTIATMIVIDGESKELCGSQQQYNGPQIVSLYGAQSAEHPSIILKISNHA